MKASIKIKFSLFPPLSVGIFSQLRNIFSSRVFFSEEKCRTSYGAGSPLKWKCLWVFPIQGHGFDNSEFLKFVKKIFVKSSKSLVQNIVAIDNEAEAVTYLRNFFGENQGLITEYVRRRFPRKSTGNRPSSGRARKQFEAPGRAQPQLQIKSKKKKGRKDKNSNIIDEPVPHRPKSPDTPQSAAALSAALFGVGDQVVEVIPEPIEEPEPEVPQLQGKWAKKAEKPKKQQRDTSFTLPKAYQPEPPKVQRSRKKKYRNINDATDVVLLPGRHKCDCQAQKHDLIANCTACGRIICAQEGEGPCLFCGKFIAESETGRDRP